MRKITKRIVHMRHPSHKYFTRMTYARQRKGMSPYITRPHRFRHR